MRELFRLPSHPRLITEDKVSVESCSSGTNEALSEALYMHINAWHLNMLIWSYTLKMRYEHQLIVCK